MSVERFMSRAQAVYVRIQSFLSANGFVDRSTKILEDLLYWKKRRAAIICCFVSASVRFLFHSENI